MKDVVCVAKRSRLALLTHKVSIHFAVYLLVQKIYTILKIILVLGRASFIRGSSSEIFESIFCWRRLT